MNDSKQDSNSAAAELRLKRALPPVDCGDLVESTLLRLDAAEEGAGARRDAPELRLKDLPRLSVPTRVLSRALESINVFRKRRQV